MSETVGLSGLFRCRGLSVLFRCQGSEALKIAGLERRAVAAKIEGLSVLFGCQRLAVS